MRTATYTSFLFLSLFTAPIAHAQSTINPEEYVEWLEKGSEQVPSDTETENSDEEQILRRCRLAAMAEDLVNCEQEYWACLKASIKLEPIRKTLDPDARNPEKSFLEMCQESRDECYKNAILWAKVGRKCYFFFGKWESDRSDSTPPLVDW